MHGFIQNEYYAADSCAISPVAFLLTLKGHMGFVKTL